MSKISQELLNQVFGPGDSTTLEGRAAESTVEYVRSMDQLAPASAQVRGPRLTARQALEAYGWDRLREVTAEGSALLSDIAEAPGRALRERRLQLGLEQHHIAAKTDLPESRIVALEESRRRPIREYERVARVLGLDERMIGVLAEPKGNDRVAVRLRSLTRASSSALTPSVVIALAEAAWVAATQTRLENALGVVGAANAIEKSDDYAAPGWPAWRSGFLLADQLRERLGIEPSQPISSMRDLCENQLCVPVIQTNLGDRLAGATVECDGRRAVVLNLMGRNRDVFVRRATLAHELGHILFDPAPRLRDLRVDRYDELALELSGIFDPVEQRANAFAVQFLAPQNAAVIKYQVNPSENALADVMKHYGLSYTAATYHLWNGLNRTVNINEFKAPVERRDPIWEANESYTIDYHPIGSLVDYPSRAGRFSALVVRAASRKIISWDTGADWLACSIEELKRAVPDLRDLYPNVFSS